MATNASTIAKFIVPSPPYGRIGAPPRWSEEGRTILATIITLTISGVCLMTLGLSRPIFASEGSLNSGGTSTSPDPQEQSIITAKWDESLKRKYGNRAIQKPTQGVAHIKMTKYINGAPVRINVVEINPKLNPNLVIKPATASSQLNAKTSIRNIAQKSESIVALNGGYFKPETGVPLGSLMIDNKTLTGPIYNRVGIGISEKDGATEFSMGRIELNIELRNRLMTFKADNINQPRMLSTYTLIYTREWGRISPAPPKYGAIAVVEDGQIVKIATSAVEIPENGFVVSGPAEKINQLFGQRNLKLEISYPSEFGNSNHILGGGPYLIKDNEVYIDTKEQKLNAITGRNPRSAIGYTQDGVLIMVTVDGREESSVGMTLGQLASLMKSFECYNAMNFDGGGSSVMYVNGKIANTPSGSREGIAISNALTIRELKS